jgi:hypothetical protein
MTCWGASTRSPNPPAARTRSFPFSELGPQLDFGAPTRWLAQQVQRKRMAPVRVARQVRTTRTPRRARLFRHKGQRPRGPSGDLFHRVKGAKDSGDSARRLLGGDNQHRGARAGVELGRVVSNCTRREQPCKRTDVVLLLQHGNELDHCLDAVSC